MSVSQTDRRLVVVVGVQLTVSTTDCLFARDCGRCTRTICLIFSFYAPLNLLPYCTTAQVWPKHQTILNVTV